MKILLPARHGLGDVLERYFIVERGRRILARVRAGLASGAISSAMVVYEHFYNQSTGDLLRALPFDVSVKTTSEFTEIKADDRDNQMPDTVRWHQNVETNPPAGFERLGDSAWVECPIRRPEIEMPHEYVLFSDGATAADRALTDPAIYPFLQEVTGLPIVKVGQGRDSVPADLNLCNRLTITESLYLAKSARLIVAPLTFFRTLASLFGTPVIELAEHATSGTLERTAIEYASGRYGMSSSQLNQWFRWPADGKRISNAIRAMRRVGS